MALILVFHNDGKSDTDVCDYNVRVMVGDGTEERSHTLELGRFVGHKRSDGWAALVNAYMKQRDEDWSRWHRGEEKA